MATNLPYDVIDRIVSFTNIGYIWITLCTIGYYLNDRDKSKIANRRLSPLVYLSKFTKNSSLLLQTMRETKTVLSGSRAAEYFTPGISTENSDWDFYCPDIRNNVVLFIHFIEQLGFKFETLEEDRHYNSTDEKLAVLSGRKGKTKVQIIVSRQPSMIATVLNFGSSMTQCIISGYCAISLYHVLLRDNKAVLWKENIRKQTRQSIRVLEDDDTTIDRLKNLAIDLEPYTAKYKRRNIEFVQYLSYLSSTQHMSYFPTVHKRLRSIFDDASYVVNFRFRKSTQTNYTNSFLHLHWTDVLNSTNIRHQAQEFLHPISYHYMTHIWNEKRIEELDNICVSNNVCLWIAQNVELQCYHYYNMYSF